MNKKNSLKDSTEFTNILIYSPRVSKEEWEELERRSDSEYRSVLKTPKANLCNATFLLYSR